MDRRLGWVSPCDSVHVSQNGGKHGAVEPVVSLRVFVHLSVHESKYYNIYSQQLGYKIFL